MTRNEKWKWFFSLTASIVQLAAEQQRLAVTVTLLTGKTCSVALNVLQQVNTSSVVAAEKHYINAPFRFTAWEGTLMGLITRQNHDVPLMCHHYKINNLSCATSEKIHIFTSTLCTSLYKGLTTISVCVLPTSKVSLGEEVLDEVCVSREEQVVQLVYTHADHGVDVQPPTQVSAERLHFTCRSDGKQERSCFCFWSF